LLTIVVSLRDMKKTPSGAVCDRATLELHLKQTRLSLLTAIETFKALSALPSTNIGEAA
jgi:hypothetical protein